MAGRFATNDLLRGLQTALIVDFNSLPGVHLGIFVCSGSL